MLGFQSVGWVAKRVQSAFSFPNLNRFIASKMFNDSAPVINTTDGPIRGEKCTSIYGDDFYSFQKVPYARPPLGELRFKAPVPPQPWTEVIDCTHPLPKALQLGYTNNVEGSEDCLYLTISTKTLVSEKPLPVLVFIHGGGFIRGDPNRGPDYFMMRNVVLISIAYRLGAFGFASFKDPSLGIPGNAGLKDQVQALRWIKENVHHFNGDPQNVTVFGESAGGSSVHHLLLTPAAEGLFQKAIVMSGVALCPFGLSRLDNPTYRLAEKMGYKGKKSDTEIFDFFQQAAPESFFANILTHDDYMNDIHFGFIPCIEPYESNFCIISSSLTEVLPTAWGNKIPILIGGTSDEGLLVYGLAKNAPFLINDLNTSPEYFLPLDIRYKLQPSERYELSKRIKETHFGNNEINQKSLLSFCEYITYKAFWLPIVKSIAARMAEEAAPTFLYRFDFDSPTFNHHRIKFCGNECRGVAHADDLSYLFYGDFAEKLQSDTPEFKTIVRMIDLWTNFATKSDPNCSHIHDWLPLKDARELTCLNISTELTIIPLPELAKLGVWLEIYDKISKTQNYGSEI